MSQPPELTISAALRSTRLALMDAGIEAAGIEAKWLLEGVTGLDHAGLIGGGDQALEPRTAVKLQTYISERLAGRPIGRVLGWSEFYGRRFDVSDETLDPRADTETIVDAALERFAKNANFRFADIGTGTGAIGITIASERPNARGVLTDVSAQALLQARSNAERHAIQGRTDLHEGDLFDPLEGAFDLIVSNPPYIKTAVINQLSGSVRDHDPAVALDGGADGLDLYRRLVAKAPAHLAKDGLLILEIGFDQSEDVMELVEESQGLSFVKLKHDLGGNPRVIIAKRDADFANAANMG